MVSKEGKSGLAAYLGKYADQVFMDRQPVLETDEYSLASYCRVKVRSDDGESYFNVPLGPTEVYAYPDGDQTRKPVFEGILDPASYLVPCHKNERGDFEIITEDQQIQVIPSATTVAREAGLPQTILKTNLLNHEVVFQSEEKIKAPDGKSFRESEAYTITHMSAGKPVGPIEYYMQPQNGTGKAEFFGLLGVDGQLTPCTRNADGDFEFEDENHQKQVIQSAENELKETPDKPYQVSRTDYFMGQPIQQKTIKEHGKHYTLTYASNKIPCGPVEYYIELPSGKNEFVGLLSADGRLVPCARNAEGNFEFEDENHQKQVVKSAQNELADHPKEYQVLRTDYELGQPVKQYTLPDVIVRSSKDENIQSSTSTSVASISVPIHGCGR